LSHFVTVLIYSPLESLNVRRRVTLSKKDMSGLVM
jgi:hypothetical protein